MPGSYDAPMTHPDPIYLNACGRSLAAPETLRVMADYLACEAQEGELQAEARYQEALGAVRGDAAGVLGAGDVGFGNTTSQIWARIAGALPKTRGRILISDYEWGFNLRFWQQMVQGTDLRLEVVPSFPGGVFDLSAWQARMDGDVVAVSVPLVTSLCGIAFPVAQIAGLERPEGALLLVDAAQGIGRMDLAEPLAGCDVAVATARKWVRGPRQTAVFRISSKAQRVLGLPVADIEAADVNGALRLGLGCALRPLVQGGAEAVRAQVQRLDQRLREGLTEAGHTLLTVGDRAPGTLCLSVPQDQRDRVTARLEGAGIIGKWLNPAVEEPLAPYPPERALLRLSPHVYNSMDDIDRALAALGRAEYS